MPYSRNVFLQARPDMANNWANIVAYRQNPNDPRFVNDPNIASLSAQFANEDDYYRNSYDHDTAAQGIGGAAAADNPQGASVSGSPSSGFSTLAPNVPQATVNPITGQNYNQVQNANQGGTFNTEDTNIGTQHGTTNQTQTGAQSGTSTQNTSSTSTATPNDTLGFGALLQGQAGTVGASDAARNSFLTDVMQTGGTQFGQQLDAGIRSSLSGPQMTGAGDSARARAAGYAAANTGRENLGQRLGAAHELAGPTGLASLSTAANPYIGQTNATFGSADSISNALSSLNTSGLSDLINRGSEVSSGSTAAQSSQAGAGVIPQGQPVKSGGCVLCTAAIELDLPKAYTPRILRKVIAHKLNVQRKRFSAASRGYFYLFTPLAAWLLRHPTLASLLFPLARAVVYEELRISGRCLCFRWDAWLVHWAGHCACALAGTVLRVPDHVTNPTILNIARKHNILFEIKGDTHNGFFL